MSSTYSVPKAVLIASAALVVLWVLLWHPTPLHKETLRVAVASNFYSTLRQLVPIFEKNTGVKLVLISGSSGKLYTQIEQGLAVDLFLSADKQWLQLLEQKGLLAVASRQDYSRGILVLWSPKYKDIKQRFLTAQLSHLAIANPKVAPYGKAAEQALAAMGLTKVLDPALVYAENVVQAQQLAEVGAKAGLISLAQVARLHQRRQSPGYYWKIPEKYYHSIDQQMAIMASSRHPELARRFQQFLLSDVVQNALIGYGLKPVIGA